MGGAQNNRNFMKMLLSHAASNERIYIDMLHLMKEYIHTIIERDTALYSVIDLLTRISVLLETFRDKGPVSQYEDIRLKQLGDVLVWFRMWEKNNIHGEKRQDECLISMQTRDNITITIPGFR